MAMPSHTLMMKNVATKVQVTNSTDLMKDVNPIIATPSETLRSCLHKGAITLHQVAINHNHQDETPGLSRAGIKRIHARGSIIVQLLYWLLQ